MFGENKKGGRKAPPSINDCRLVAGRCRRRSRGRRRSRSRRRSRGRFRSRSRRRSRGRFRSRGRRRSRSFFFLFAGRKHRENAREHHNHRQKTKLLKHSLLLSSKNCSARSRLPAHPAPTDRLTACPYNRGNLAHKAAGGNKIINLRVYYQ